MYGSFHIFGKKRHIWWFYSLACLSAARTIITSRDCPEERRRYGLPRKPSEGFMQLDNRFLEDQVITPTLRALQIDDENVRFALLNALEQPPRVGLFSADPNSYGIFHISERQHRDIWDQFLAQDPDLASRVRGLASQRAFLENPELELHCNLRYCAAIAALLWLRSCASVRSKRPVKKVRVSYA